ncbi:MAG TPA: hypothetical protein VE030_11370 [Burkholderiales bacterium]|nr:hypothetical protein [Burkholderiales bacterium]
MNRLKDAFPVPMLAEGRVIEHADLEEIVKAKRGGQRYYGVINSWINSMKNTNGIFMTWETSVGVKVLGPAEILAHAEIRTRQKIKQTGNAVKTFVWVDRTRLDSTGQQRLDHQERVANAIRDALNTARKDLAIDLAPVKSLPKPKMIREA